MSENENLVSSKSVMVDLLKELAKNDPAKFLQDNMQLQIKKNQLRQQLAQMGILKKDGYNEYGKYKYFSEAQYKELFTKLFSEAKLELKANIVSCQSFRGTDNMPFGRRVELEICLLDCETGFFELSCVIGEGVDASDKATYKANTGAMKYYLANTFLVATGADPENETDNPITNSKKTYKAYAKKPIAKKVVSELSELLENILSDNEKEAVIKKYGVEHLWQLSDKILQYLVDRKQNSILQETEAC